MHVSDCPDMGNAHLGQMATKLSPPANKGWNAFVFGTANA